MCYIFAVCFIGVCSALQGPPDALQLAAYICVTCDPVKLIPGGPGPLNQNLPWVRAGWRDTAFHFQDWQSLGKSKFFGLKSQLHPCWTGLSLDNLLSFSEFPSSSIRAGTTLWACKGFSSLVLWTFWAASLFPVKDCLVHQRVSGSIRDSPTHWVPAVLLEVWQSKLSPDIAQCSAGTRNCLYLRPDELT